MPDCDVPTRRPAPGPPPAPGLDAKPSGQTRSFDGIGGQLVLATWFLAGVGVLVCALLPFSSLTEPAMPWLKTVGWSILCTYAMLFVGWRVTSVFCKTARQRLGSMERLVVEYGLGAAVFAAALYTGAVIGRLEPRFALAVLAVALAGRHVAFLRELAARFRGAGAPSVGGRIAQVLLAALWVMTLLAVWTPATSQDALVYHLAVPAAYIREGGFHHLPGNFYAAFPQNIDMLFTFGLLLDGDSLAKVFHWTTGAAAALATGALATRVAGRRAGASPLVLAALLFASIPTVALISTWAYVDLGVVLYCVVSSLLFLRFLAVDHEGRDERATWALLILSSVFAGLAAGVKYTGGAQGIFVALLVLVPGVCRRRASGVSLLRAATVGVVSLLVALPWYAKNLWLTGNPLFPFVWSLFGGEGWNEERAATLSRMLGEWGAVDGIGDLLLLPWRLTVEAMFFDIQRFDGVVGAAFLIGTPLLLIGCRQFMQIRRGRMFFVALAFAALHMLLWIATTHQVRFLLPALAIAAALMAASLSCLSLRWRTVPLALLIAAVVFDVFLVGVHFASKNPLPVLLGLESRDAYMEREVPGDDYSVFRFIDEELPVDSHILFGSCGNPGFLTQRRYTSDALFENATLARHLQEAGGPGPEGVVRLGQIFGREGYTHLLFRFDTVFDHTGRKSEIPLHGQGLLMQFLNLSARRLTEANGTCLYEILRERRPRVVEEEARSMPASPLPGSVEAAVER